MKVKKIVVLSLLAVVAILVAACAGGAQEPNDTPLATEVEMNTPEGLGMATTAAPMTTTEAAMETTEAPMGTADATGLPQTGGGTGTPGAGGTGDMTGTGTPAGGEMTGTETPGADGGTGTQTAGGGAVCQAISGNELVTQGTTIYANQCAACHGAEGAGQGAFPALANSADVTAADPTTLIEVLFNPQVHPFATTLTSEQGAAALSYVRNNFSNEAEIVCPETVDEARPTQ